jgi:hypothetical protein
MPQFTPVKEKAGEIVRMRHALQLPSLATAGAQHQAALVAARISACRFPRAVLILGQSPAGPWRNFIRRTPRVRNGDPEPIGRVSALQSTHDRAVWCKVDSGASRSRNAGTTRVPIASMARMSFV